ncbi:ammonia-forming cytochrome c nitrite reductase subunit c552 [Myxococcota bacterium]|nr:ammonia-forming cytochrome c nitrite reductase subunit c552 [Myxococcota bacterium]MBU1430793.1 ammonia-forming cytochrome c nitrite reductase subunit c552 [Myxococcota bacterium]MBU1900123.1 ammonia-forming cytochrome c nitrite reductase subunit c552 [Myxococcota bacterium]
MGDFSRKNEHRYKDTYSKMFIEDGRYFIEHVNQRGERGVYEIHLVLGQARHQVYLHKQSNGYYQVLPAYWNITDGRWRHSVEGPVVQKEALSPTHPYHWKNFGRTYNRVCMECHSSQPKRNFDLEKNEYNSEFDPIINCEACHGPGSAHIERWRSLKDVDGPDKTLAAVSSGSVEERIEICASCHAQKRIYLEGYLPGDSYYDHFAPDVWSAYQTQVDGRSSTLNYHFVDYMQSTCFRHSEEPLDCAGSCHPPHDLVSTRGSTVEEANAICTRCHIEHKIKLVEHTFHNPESEGSRCVACHMPKIDLDMDMFTTDHTIGSPLPELTRRFGIPNACNDCHAHDTPEWAEGHVQRWFGESGHFQGYRARMIERAEVLHDAFKNKKINVPILASWLSDTSKDLITRSSAAKILGDHPSPESMKALLSHKNDPHPLIRYYVMDSLGQFPLEEARHALFDALEDKTRVVRGRAYTALRLVHPEIEFDPRYARQHDEWLVRERQVRSDEPRFKSDMAMHRFSAGDLKGAEELLLHAIKVSGAVPGVRMDYIHFLLHSRRLDEAEAQARIIEEMHPNTTPARASRGLIFLGRGEAEAALKIFEALHAEGVKGAVIDQGLEAARLQLSRRPR